MRIVIMSCVALISYLLQGTFLEYAEIYNIKPNLILITVISYALIRGNEEGAVYGLFSGLLLDIMSGKGIGLYALLGMYLGLIIGRLNKNLYNENYLIAIMLTALGSFMYNFMYFLVSYSFDGYSNVLDNVLHVILPETAYNACLSIFIYFIILYINKKLDYKNTIKSY